MICGLQQSGLYRSKGWNHAESYAIPYADFPDADQVACPALSLALFPLPLAIGSLPLQTFAEFLSAMCWLCGAIR